MKLTNTQLDKKLLEKLDKTHPTTSPYTGIAH